MERKGKGEGGDKGERGEGKGARTPSITNFWLRHCENGRPSHLNAAMHPRIFKVLHFSLSLIQ